MSSTDRAPFCSLREPRVRLFQGVAHGQHAWDAWAAIHDRLGSEPLLSCGVTTVFYATGSRNAWNGSVGGGILEASIGFDLNSAATAVECSRTRGTSWVIRRSPAVVFIGSELSVLVVPDRTFTKRPPLDFRTLGNMAAALNRSDWESFAMDTGDLPPWNGTFGTFVPRSASPLRWVEVKRSVHAEAADDEIRTAIGQVTAEFARLAPFGSTTPTAAQG